MCSRRDCRLNVPVLVLILCALAMEAHGQDYYPEQVDAVSPRGDVLERDGGRSPYPTTYDMEREIPLVTTVPPLNVHNHHSLFKGFPFHEAPPISSLQGQEQIFEDGRGVDRHSTAPAENRHPAGHPLTRLVPHKDVPAFSDLAVTTATKAATPPMATTGSALHKLQVQGVVQGIASKKDGTLMTEHEAVTSDPLTTTVLRTSDLPPLNNSPTRGGPSEREVVGPALPVLMSSGRKDAAATQEPAGEQNPGPVSEVTAVMSLSSGDTDEETTTTTIITTTIITTMQTPVPCSTNLTILEGYIEFPPQPIVWSYPSLDCTHTVTVYMGYGVEIQVLNISLSEGETVTLEDLGSREPSVVANESILMKGLVVRSRSNQIAVRFQSKQPRPGSFLLRYQAFLLSCVFPQRPAYGDVSVSSLHSGGEAYFYCSTGYQLQGPSTLTCRNATTPYWSGKEPQCVAACGGMIKNATVGRIVSPGFPSNYSNNLTCHWVLEAPEGHRLHIHFEKVALAEDDDRLLIKNGNNIDAQPVYDSYEVEYLPNEGIVSSSRHLFIELTTDGSGTSTGTAIRYEAFAKGHCYEPFVKYGNFTSSDATFAVGAVVEFACDAGYTLEQGSVTMECMDPSNPQWNETEPACRAVCSGEITDSAGVVLSPNWPEAYDRGQDCIWGIHVEEDKRIMLDIQLLNVGKNDLLTFYDGDDLTAKMLGQYSGSRPRFKLYTSSADVTIQFQSDPATNVYGYHNGFVVHFFEVPRNDTCPELPEISNGWKSTSHPELIHGTVVTYQCYPGFEVVGTEILMCQWDLTWSGDLPTCERVILCTDPGVVEHSRRVMSGPRLTVGSTVQYICNKGYALSGNSLLTCYNRDASGPRWTERPPKCVPEAYEACRNPGASPFSIQSAEKRVYQAGETLHFSCLTGYELRGEPSIRCVPGHPSRWSGAPPTCKALSSVEYVNERRLDVSSSDFSMDGTSVAMAVFIPVALVLVLIAGVYLYFSRAPGKSIRATVSTSLPYDHIATESAFDNPIYETTNNEETREYEVSI
ncbi:seizure protein 6 homolog [Megalops cyprinoides]|uniref:seizure protein 6 homolog n=1 Tax=Megalops cyprinoides TaxID=118141 RepID=UPI0018653F9F|nr:seizure protein 6 homolog [Megalops cyprinoides]